MRDFWKISLALILCLGLAGVATAQTPDGETPAQEDVCDDEKGAAFGLCNAYCEAMDCDSDNPNANSKACDRVKANYTRITGEDRFPCEALECPCYTAEQLQAAGPINQCGENFPGFPNLAGVRYQSGGAACSGDGCLALGVLSCVLFDPINGVSNPVIPISEEDDADCRALILENCPNPNLSNGLTPSQLTGAPFFDQ
jgi:hypothetical protein